MTNISVKKNRSETYMLGNWNPTREEIEEWAYIEEALHDQDWETCVYEYENLDLIIKLAADPNCPQRKFFLSCLYVRTGDTIRIKVPEELKLLVQVLNSNQLPQETEIQNWKERSIELIKNPELYKYEFWGLGSLYVYPD